MVYCAKVLLDTGIRYSRAVVHWKTLGYDLYIHWACLLWSECVFGKLLPTTYYQIIAVSSHSLTSCSRNPTHPLLKWLAKQFNNNHTQIMDCWPFRVPGKSLQSERVLQWSCDYYYIKYEKCNDNKYNMLTLSYSSQHTLMMKLNKVLSSGSSSSSLYVALIKANIMSQPLGGLGCVNTHRWITVADPVFCGQGCKSRA